MEFKKERVYSAVNADELKPGDKVIVADTIATLNLLVRETTDSMELAVLQTIGEDDEMARFKTSTGEWCLAYLMERKENCTNCIHYTEVCLDCSKGKDHRCYKYETEQKSEPHYRPFKDVDELVKEWNKKLGYTDPTGSKFTEPYIWVRQKECSKGGLLITYFGEDEVKTDMGFMTMEKLFNDYTFLDGSPCGVEE